MPENKQSKDRYPSLLDLIDIKEWQKIQNNFSAITDIAIRILDPRGNLVTTPSLIPRLCSQILKDSGMKDIICGNCLPAFLGGKAIVDKNLCFICEASLYNFVIPLELSENKVLGYIILGPVILVMRKKKEEYQKIAESLNLNFDDFWSALLEIKVTSWQGMKSLVELIGDVCEYAINLTYKKLLKEKEVVMPQDLAKLNRIFDVLLDVAFDVCRADIGSVMFLDDARKNLTIRISRGIPKEITKSARVKLGEGISGLVAKEGRSYLIDDNIKDNRIRPYLNRPHISSSMVLPIKLENRVVGVMNLGALKTSPVKFGLDNIGVMNKLIDLVTVAISPAK